MKGMGLFGERFAGGEGGLRFILCVHCHFMEPSPLVVGKSGVKILQEEYLTWTSVYYYPANHCYVQCHPVVCSSHGFAPYYPRCMDGRATDVTK